MVFDDRCNLFLNDKSNRRAYHLEQQWHMHHECIRSTARWVMNNKRWKHFWDQKDLYKFMLRSIRTPFASASASETHCSRFGNLRPSFDACWRRSGKNSEHYICRCARLERSVLWLRQRHLQRLNTKQQWNAFCLFYPLQWSSCMFHVKGRSQVWRQPFRNQRMAFDDVVCSPLVLLTRSEKKYQVFCCTF